MGSYKTTRRVEFRDTDTGGIMHFSVFFTWMEECEHELLRELGMSVMTPYGDVTLSWPRVSAHCDYKSPVQFEDVLDVTVSVEHIGHKSVKYGFKFTHADEQVAVGYLVAVCCEVDHKQPPKAVTIPDGIKDKLARYGS